jgi:hypothetical protein
MEEIVLHQEELVRGWQPLQVQTFELKEPAKRARMRDDIHLQLSETLAASGRHAKKRAR